MIDRIYPSLYVCRFQNAVLRCPTARLHCFLSSHWPSFKFLSFMAFFIHSIQFFFGLSRALFCFGIHFNAILGNFLLPFLKYLHLDEGIFCRVRRLAWFNDPESYAGDGVATGRAILAGQVKGEHSDKERYTGPPGWELVGWASTPLPGGKKTHVKKPRQRLGKSDGLYNFSIHSLRKCTSKK